MAVGTFSRTVHILALCHVPVVELGESSVFFVVTRVLLSNCDACNKIHHLLSFKDIYGNKRLYFLLTLFSILQSSNANA